MPINVPMYLHGLMPPHMKLTVLLALDVELSQPFEFNLVHHQLLQTDVLAQELVLAGHLVRIEKEKIAQDLPGSFTTKSKCLDKIK